MLNHVEPLPKGSYHKSNKAAETTWYNAVGKLLALLQLATSMPVGGEFHAVLWSSQHSSSHSSQQSLGWSPSPPDGQTSRCLRFSMFSALDKPNQYLVHRQGIQVQSCFTNPVSLGIGSSWNTSTVWACAELQLELQCWVGPARQFRRLVPGSHLINHQNPRSDPSVPCLRMSLQWDDALLGSIPEIPWDPLRSPDASDASDASQVSILATDRFASVAVFSHVFISCCFSLSLSPSECKHVTWAQNLWNVLTRAALGNMSWCTDMRLITIFFLATYC